METAEQIRIKMAQMRLAALETEYCNANWTFNLKLKSLKEQLQHKNKRQIDLTAQLMALRQCFAQHQAQIKNALAEVANLEDQNKCQPKKASKSPNLQQTIARISPKKPTTGLFFRVAKQEKKKLNFSPNLSKTPATTSWQKMYSINNNTTKNPEKTNTRILFKNKNSLKSFGSEKTLECSTTVELKKQSPDLTKRIDDKNGSGKLIRKRQEKWLLKEK